MRGVDPGISLLGKQLFKGENWPKMGYYNPVYKNEHFFLPKLTFQHHLHKIYIYIYI